ncbi:fructosamine kinase family protein [Flavobacterium sp. ASW18X]|uniref:fructosamine kinase family protein n=1 Tax=Flavobacterium sp. ASW18X TaxID=2572595 RepID=UPI0010AE0E49|nr:fructosamine kinase family protein [Flavobacterium sp. ASW18X]TKD66193.1 fructosamine kinase family protein [Flavobacterium sp. ASW18X]
MMKWIYELFESDIKSITSLSGGNVSQVFKVVTTSDVFVVKCNYEKNAEVYFKAEVNGLHQIKATNTIETPAIHSYGKIENNAYLILEWIPTKNADQEAMHTLGIQLSQLHSTTETTYFGAKEHNFIGNLPQNNTINPSWSTFYALQRLYPQLGIARKLGYLLKEEIPNLDNIQKVMTTIADNTKPSLLHGDLWHGNILIHENGTPYLIDPSVYYGHNEMDLAMTKLFGGFSNNFYQGYHENIPPHKNQNALTEVYQLYYLLVHLNMFGNSYRSKAVELLKRYFL